MVVEFVVFVGGCGFVVVGNWNPIIIAAEAKTATTAAKGDH